MNLLPLLHGVEEAVKELGGTSWSVGGAAAFVVELGAPVCDLHARPVVFEEVEGTGGVEGGCGVLGGVLEGCVVADGGVDV